MKAFKLLGICLVVFTAVPVFAGSCGGGGGGCDKDKDKQTFTMDAQYLGSCGGCTKPKPEPKPDPQCGGSGCDKNKGETKT